MTKDIERMVEGKIANRRASLERTRAEAQKAIEASPFPEAKKAAVKDEFSDEITGDDGQPSTGLQAMLESQLPDKVNFGELGTDDRKVLKDYYGAPQLADFEFKRDTFRDFILECEYVFGKKALSPDAGYDILQLDRVACGFVGIGSFIHDSISSPNLCDP